MGRSQEARTQGRRDIEERYGMLNRFLDDSKTDSCRPCPLEEVNAFAMMSRLCDAPG